MADNYLDKSQFIKPIGETQVVPSSDNTSKATQKGLVNGRIVNIEINIDSNKPSQRKVQKLVKEAIQKSSLALQQVQSEHKKPIKLTITREGSVESSNPLIAPPKLKEGPEIKLSVGEDHYQSTPLFSAKEIKEYSPGKLAQVFNRMRASIRNLTKSKELDFKREASISLHTEHLAVKGSANVAPSIVQKAISSGKVEMELRQGTPSNFLEAYEAYSKNSEFKSDYFNKHPDKLKDLPAGECFIFPMRSFDHKIGAMAIKEHDGSVTLHLYNSGEGLSHHFSDPADPTSFQRAFILKNISPDKLQTALTTYEDDFSLRNKKHLDGRSLIDGLYASLKLIGKPVRVEDEAFWGKVQTGYSCVGEGENILLKANLTDKSFQDLRVQLKTHAAFKNFSKIMRGSETSYTFKLSTLDIVTTLKKGNLNPKMGEALAAIEEKVKGRLNRRKELKLTRSLKKEFFEDFAKIDSNSKKPEDLIKRAAHLIATYQLDEATKVLDQLDALPLPNSKKEVDDRNVTSLILFVLPAAEDKAITFDLANVYAKANQILKKRALQE